MIDSAWIAAHSRESEDLFRPVDPTELEAAVVGAAILGWCEPPDPAACIPLRRLAELLVDPACPREPVEREFWLGVREPADVAIVVAIAQREAVGPTWAPTLRALLHGEHLRRAGLAALDEQLARAREARAVLLAGAEQARGAPDPTEGAALALVALARLLGGPVAVAAILDAGLVPPGAAGREAVARARTAQ